MCLQRLVDTRRPWLLRFVEADIRKTFKNRAAEIADHANNTQSALGEGGDFLRGLDEMERQRNSILPILLQFSANTLLSLSSSS